METVKIKDIKTGAIKVIKKSLAGDFVGTGKFVLVEEKKPQNSFTKSFVEKKEK